MSDTNLLARAFDWVKARAVRDNEIAAMTRADLRFLAADPGLSEADLLDVMPRVSDHSDLMDKMMRARRLDPDAIRGFAAGNSRRARRRSTVTHSAVTPKPWTNCWQPHLEALLNHDFHAPVFRPRDAGTGRDRRFRIPKSLDRDLVLRHASPDHRRRDHLGAPLRQRHIGGGVARRIRVARHADSRFLPLRRVPHRRGHDVART